jgi:hypothetical protein
MLVLTLFAVIALAALGLAFDHHVHAAGDRAGRDPGPSS